MTTYRYKQWTVVFFCVLFIIFLLLPFWDYVSPVRKGLLWLIGLPSCLWSLFYSYHVRVTLSHQGLSFESSFFVSRRQLDWGEIGKIVDDTPFPWLQFSHRYNIIPQQHLLGKRWIVIPACFEHYREILRQVVLHVSPATKVAPTILKLVELTPQDIGRCYQQPLT